MNNFTPLLQVWQQYLPFLALIAVWTLIWKGLALWQAARRSERGWFIALLIVNSLGILELIYIFFIANHKEETLGK